MKLFAALAVAAVFVSSTAADARGLRLSLPRLSAPATISPVRAAVPTTARVQRSGMIILPGVGASRASANTSRPLLDDKSGAQDWNSLPFAARPQAANLPAYQPPQPQAPAAPKIEKAAFVCPPSQNVGGFCVLN